MTEWSTSIAIYKRSGDLTSSTMRYPPNYRQMQYLLFAGVLAFVIITTLQVTPGGEERTWTAGECESCHTSLKPALIEVNVEDNGDGSHDLVAQVTNVEEHEVRELQARVYNVNDSQERKGPHLHEGRDHTFRWTLSDAELEKYVLEVDLLAYYDHNEVGPDKQSYTFQQEQEGFKMVKWEKDWDFGLGQVLGLAMATLVLGSCLTGLYQSGRLQSPDWAAKASYRYRDAGHKLTGLLLLGLAIPHAFLLQLGLYDGTTGGLIGGLMTLLALLLLTYLTLDRKKLIKRWGWKTWQQVHRVLIIGFLLIFLSHVYQISSHLPP